MSNKVVEKFFKYFFQHFQKKNIVEDKYKDANKEHVIIYHLTTKIVLIDYLLALQKLLDKLVPKKPAPSTKLTMFYKNKLDVGGVDSAGFELLKKTIGVLLTLQSGILALVSPDDIKKHEDFCKSVKDLIENSLIKIGLSDVADMSAAGSQDQPPESFQVLSDHAQSDDEQVDRHELDESLRLLGKFGEKIFAEFKLMKDFSDKAIKEKGNDSEVALYDYNAMLLENLSRESRELQQEADKIIVHKSGCSIM